MSETNPVQQQAISTRFACKSVPGPDEEEEINDQDHHMIQEDEPLFELEAIGHPVSLAEVNGEQVRDFEFVWMTAKPIHEIIGDHRSPTYRRMQDTFDIVSQRYRINLRTYAYLEPDQYDFFHRTMAILEELLSKVQVTDMHDGDCIFCLNRQCFSRFMSVLWKQKADAQASLEVNGIPNLLLPPWGSNNNVTVWLTLNELEVFGICLRAETEHFLATLLAFHDWKTGTPKWFHEEQDVTPAPAQVQFPKRKESRQPTEIPRHTNGRRCQPSFSEIRNHSQSVCPSGAPASASVMNTHTWTSYQFKDSLLDPNLQTRVSNSCIMFVQSLLSLMMKGGS